MLTDCGVAKAYNEKKFDFFFSSNTHILFYLVLQYRKQIEFFSNEELLR